MILLIVYKERDDRTGKYEEIVSHGIDLETDRIVILPQVNPLHLRAKYDLEAGEYFLE